MPKHICLAAKDSGFPCSTQINKTILISIIFLILLGISIPSSLPILFDNPIVHQISPLQQRLQATESWLLNQQNYTIQVIQIKVDKIEDLQRFLHKPEIQSLLDNLYIYNTGINWEIMYGEFTDTKIAATTIESLPVLLQRNKPFLRKIADIK